MRAVYPGSFDPVTKGHLNIIERASQLCEEVYVAIMPNPKKKACFSLTQRQCWLEESTKEWTNVHIICGEGELTVQLCQRLEANVLIRGLRNTEDFVAEQKLAEWNYELGAIETLYLGTRPQYFHVSSSMVRELLAYHQNIEAYVPQIVADEVKQDESAK